MLRLMGTCHCFSPSPLCAGGHLPRGPRGGAAAARPAGAAHNQGPRARLWAVQRAAPTHLAEGEGPGCRAGAGEGGSKRAGCWWPPRCRESWPPQLSGCPDLMAGRCQGLLEARPGRRCAGRTSASLPKSTAPTAPWGLGPPAGIILDSDIRDAAFLKNILLP